MFDKLLRHFGSPAYEKEQENRVSYEVEITNISKTHQDAVLIIPIVSTRETQTLLELNNTTFFLEKNCNIFLQKYIKMIELCKKYRMPIKHISLPCLL